MEMRKIIIFNMASLDGLFEGPKRDISWHNVDEEFNEFAIQQLHSVDTLIFGRITFEMMANYWPTPAAIQNDPIVAGLMNAKPKIVFSRTLQKVEWNNSRLIKEFIPDEINKLKEQSGKDLIIFGSADLAASMMKASLIDEYRIMLNPVVLGSGAPLFKGIKDRLDLKLIISKTFRSGNVLLYYQPDKKNRRRNRNDQQPNAIASSQIEPHAEGIGWICGRVGIGKLTLSCARDACGLRMAGRRGVPSREDG